MQDFCRLLLFQLGSMFVSSQLLFGRLCQQKVALSRVVLTTNHCGPSQFSKPFSWVMSKQDKHV